MNRDKDQMLYIQKNQVLSIAITGWVHIFLNRMPFWSLWKDMFCPILCKQYCTITNSIVPYIQSIIHYIGNGIQIYDLCNFGEGIIIP